MDDKEFSFPFNSVLDEDGFGDRLYHAEDFSKYFANFISNGVYPNPSTGLKVNALNGLVLQVTAGSGFINGYGYVLNEDLEISLNTANASYSRKDIVVLRLDFINRYIRIFVKEGEAKANVLAPEIERNSDIYELQLAEVTVKAGVVEITQSQILDTRLNSDVCGIVTALIDNVDTTLIFNQYDVYLQEKMEEWDRTKAQQEQEFNEKINHIQSWYNSVKQDITRLQTFDFDNLAELPGITRSTVFLDNNDVEEVIKNTANDKKIAERLTQFLLNKNVVENIKVYEEDGVTIMKETTINTVFNDDGSVTEVVR